MLIESNYTKILVSKERDLSGTFKSLELVINKICIKLIYTMI